MKFNHNRPLSEFQSAINKLKENGYVPIAVSQLYFEDTFVFETKEEAIKAYNQFERDINGKSIGEIVGWWYGKEDFENDVKKYEALSDNGSKVLVHWLSNEDDKESFYQDGSTQRANGLLNKMKQLYDNHGLTTWEYLEFRIMVRSFCKENNLYFDENKNFLYKRSN